MTSVVMERPAERPAVEHTTAATLQVYPSQWEYCRKQPGGASGFIRELIAADMAAPAPGDEPRVRENESLTSRPTLLLPSQWKHCKSQPEGGAPYVRRLIDAHMDGAGETL